MNAANSGLAPGGGVCGAIHRAAGPELARACAEVAPCPTGEARLTPGFRLPARFVIHAVGPIWQGGQRGEQELLASAYRSSLQLARAEGLKSIAFPAISTGIYGYPLREATHVAVATVRGELADASSITTSPDLVSKRALLHHGIPRCRQDNAPQACRGGLLSPFVDRPRGCDRSARSWN